MATDWSALTVGQLEDELTSRGLTTAGKKEELIGRLTAYLDESQKAEPVADAAEKSSAGDSSIQVPESNGSGEPADKKTAEEPIQSTDQAGADSDQGSNAGNVESSQANASKATTMRRVIDLPDPETMWKETKGIHSVKGVGVCSLAMSDLSHPVIHSCIESCASFTTNFYCTSRGGKHISWRGMLKLYYADEEEAANATKKLKSFRDGLTVLSLSPNRNAANELHQLWCKRPQRKTDILRSLMFVENLSQDVTLEELWSTFPNAYEIFLPLDESLVNKGYAYVAFETVEEMNEVIQEKNKSLLHGMKLSMQAYDERWVKVQPPMSPAVVQKCTLAAMEPQKRKLYTGTIQMLRSFIAREPESPRAIRLKEEVPRYQAILAEQLRLSKGLKFGQDEDPTQEMKKTKSKGRGYRPSGKSPVQVTGGSPKKKVGTMNYVRQRERDRNTTVRVQQLRKSYVDRQDSALQEQLDGSFSPKQPHRQNQQQQQQLRQQQQQQKQQQLLQDELIQTKLDALQAQIQLMMANELTAAKHQLSAPQSQPKPQPKPQRRARSPHTPRNPQANRSNQANQQQRPSNQSGNARQASQQQRQQPQPQPQPQQSRRMQTARSPGGRTQQQNQNLGGYPWQPDQQQQWQQQQTGSRSQTAGRGSRMSPVVSGSRGHGGDGYRPYGSPGQTKNRGPPRNTYSQFARQNGNNRPPAQGPRAVEDESWDVDYRQVEGRYSDRYDGGFAEERATRRYGGESDSTGSADLLQALQELVSLNQNPNEPAGGNRRYQGGSPGYRPQGNQGYLY